MEDGSGFGGAGTSGKLMRLDPKNSETGWLDEWLIGRLRERGDSVVFPDEEEPYVSVGGLRVAYEMEFEDHAARERAWQSMAAHPETGEFVERWDQLVVGHGTRKIWRLEGNCFSGSRHGTGVADLMAVCEFLCGR